MLLWRMFADLSTRAGLAVRFTYRAVGLSAGQQEFAAGVSDWGCGDIPMSASGFKAAAAAARVRNMDLVPGGLEVEASPGPLHGMFARLKAVRSICG
ncbi:hypothetical protein MNEG_6980 [Monoraphidium neglectum]|uniref:Uncharacterized protein n=1 Tax=Monoraphidium neglectum TaxID=145388 RepID=A0A0D2L0Q9_9CHLO|nr:hypothetical protein MNEG_6980 [Monoraphidium neglectum]KIZ00984.1 hypothetical protein MNEG_6980 [Monoraphidium neglectum]|eukprot:XP_013900003.1 hypothetical protein MNEG_6980 [Monoraphidium neglectum]